MHFMSRLLACFLSSFLAIACSGPVSLGTASTGTPPDAGAASPPPDAGTAPAPDAGTDAGGDTADAGTTGGGSGGGTADAGTAGGGTVDGGTAGGGGAPDAGTGGGTSTAPEQLTTGANAIALAIDATNVYFLARTSSTDAVRSVPKAGGASATLSAGRQGHPARSLIATGDAVLWESLDCSDPCDYPGSGHEWAIFESDGGSVRQVAPLFASGGLGASATTAFSRSFDLETGRWDLLGCARDGSGCSTIVIDSPLREPVYFDSGKLYFISEPSDADFGLRSILQSYDPGADPIHRFGSMTLQNAQGISGLRVNGSGFALRSHGNVWAGHLDSTYSMIRGAPNGDDVDISHGRVYWNQSRTDQGPGCLGSANIDGTDPKCVDEGDHDYAGVRVDETAVYFIRDGEIFRIAK
jgi:hypothetical protein